MGVPIGSFRPSEIFLCVFRDGYGSQDIAVMSILIETVELVNTSMELITSSGWS